MLYLIIGRPKKGRVLPTKREFLELVVKEWETVLVHRETGRIKDVYGFRDGNGGIIISDVDSRDEVENMVRELPLYRFADWEIIPLMSADEGLATAKRKLTESFQDEFVE